MQSVKRCINASPATLRTCEKIFVAFRGASGQKNDWIGMYGMTRPDKFDLGKRPTGSQSCGSMVWQLPATPGQYDFRMFQSDITDVGQGAYQLLGQSNVVTVS